MSAYGTITATGRPTNLLPPTTWELPEPAPGKPAAPFRRLVLHHLRLDNARALPGLLEYTHRVFAAEIEAGRTYPQEVEGALAPSSSSRDPDADAGGDDSEITTTTILRSDEPRCYTRAAFEAYFWAADVVVAIGTNDPDRPLVVGEVETLRAGRSWKDVLVGFYYIKPNYPGRSSHVSDYKYYDSCQTLRDGCEEAR